MSTLISSAADHGHLPTPSTQNETVFLGLPKKCPPCLGHWNFLHRRSWKMGFFSPFKCLTFPHILVLSGCKIFEASNLQDLCGCLRLVSFNSMGLKWRFYGPFSWGAPKKISANLPTSEATAATRAGVLVVVDLNSRNGNQLEICKIKNDKMTKRFLSLSDVIFSTALRLLLQLQHVALTLPLHKIQLLLHFMQPKTKRMEVKNATDLPVICIYT